MVIVFPFLGLCGSYHVQTSPKVSQLCWLQLGSGAPELVTMAKSERPRPPLSREGVCELRAADWGFPGDLWMNIAKLQLA